MFTYTLAIKTNDAGTILIGNLSYVDAAKLARRATKTYQVVSIEFIRE